MNKFIVALAAVVLTGVAYAQPGSGACQQHPDSPFCQGGGGGGGGGTTNTEGGGQSQGQQQGQQQGQAQGQLQGQEQSSSSTSGAIGVGLGYGEGGSARQGQAQESSNVNLNANRNVNDISNDSYSTSRSASASDSDSRSTSVAAGGSAVSGGNTQGVTVDASDKSVLIYEGEKYPAAQAASVFAQQCQTGMSGQVMDGGFSVVNSDQFCDYVKAAQLAQAAYLWEMEYGSAVCSEPMADDWVEGQYVDTCVNERAEAYLEDYRENTENAISLVQRTEAFGWMDRIFGQLIRPIAVVAALILLI